MSKIQYKEIQERDKCSTSKYKYKGNFTRKKQVNDTIKYKKKRKLLPKLTYIYSILQNSWKERVFRLKTLRISRGPKNGVVPKS